MKANEAIKYLKQLYPNGGHCWLDEQRIEAIGMAVKALQEEHVSEELEKAAEQDVCEVVNTCSAIGIPNDHIPSWVQDAMINEFTHGAKWQKLQDMGITNKAQDVVADALSSADNPLDAYATEMAFMMLPATLKESYHQTNRDRICDAVRLGAKWQKGQDQSTIELAEDHAMLAGMEKMKEEMMAKAIDAHCFGFQDAAALFTFRLPAGIYLVGSKVKINVIKED